MQFSLEKMDAICYCDIHILFFRCKINHLVAITQINYMYFYCLGWVIRDMYEVNPRSWTSMMLAFQLVISMTE